MDGFLLSPQSRQSTITAIARSATRTPAMETGLTRSTIARGLGTTVDLRPGIPTGRQTAVRHLPTLRRGAVAGQV